jgi:hypothetical protein
MVVFLLLVAFERREVLTASHNYGRRLRWSIISPSRKIQVPVAASLFVRMTVAVGGCGGPPAPTQLVSFHFHSMLTRSSSASLKDKDSEPLRRYVDILADGIDQTLVLEILHESN